MIHVTFSNVSCQFSPFVFVRLHSYLKRIGTGVPNLTKRREKMNWILETYSDVYSTAMMNDVKTKHHLPAAKPSKALAKIARLFHRG